MRYDILTPLRDPGVKPRQHTVGGPRGLAYGNDKLVVNSLFFSTVALPAFYSRDGGVFLKKKSIQVTNFGILDYH